jgi:hypothetical protein
MLRVLAKSKIKDKVKIKDMFEASGILSVNQTAEQMKLANVEGGQGNTLPNRNGSRTRAQRWKIHQRWTRYEISKESQNKNIQSFIGDAPKLWNKAPTCIKMAKTLNMAKKEIRTYCKSLPV